jgi:quercetin dioxygenase-like cupin family protein
MRILPLAALVAGAAASAATAAAQPAYHPATEIVWKEGPATMPKGVRLAVLEGDPTQAGVFTIRLRFPAGMRIPAHSHTQTEHATVIAGVLHIGMGERFDSAATRALPAGSFGYWPAGMRHYAWMEGETVLQLHGQGPWTVTYVDPADDPRRAR